MRFILLVYTCAWCIQPAGFPRHVLPQHRFPLSQSCAPHTRAKEPAYRCPRTSREVPGREQQPWAPRLLRKMHRPPGPWPFGDVRAVYLANCLSGSQRPRPAAQPRVACLQRSLEEMDARIRRFYCRRARPRVNLGRIGNVPARSSRESHPPPGRFVTLTFVIV